MLKIFLPNFCRQINLSLKHFILQQRKGLQTVPFMQEKPILKINDEVFNEAVIRLFVNLQNAFRNLKGFNEQLIESISISYYPTIFKVNTKLGQINVRSQTELSTLYYTSPFTGIYKYYYDKQQNRWFSNKDKHIFEENLSREVMSKFKGILQI